MTLFGIYFRDMLDVVIGFEVLGCLLGLAFLIFAKSKRGRKWLTTP
jgi:hypothetical protein